MPEEREFPSDAFEALESLRARLGHDKTSYRYGVGLKRSHGEVLDEVALIVYVPKKLPLENLGPEERVPPTHDKFRTDVVETKRILIADSASYNPLVGGVEISPSGVPIEFGLRIERGTIGCLVRRRSDGRRLLLTAEHVASHNDGDGVSLHDSVGQPIFQPADGEGGASVVGACVDADVDLDAAIVDLNATRAAAHTVAEIGPVRGWAPSVGSWERLRKRGRTTGLTAGFVVGVVAGPDGNPREIEFVAFPPGRIVDHGDSGAVLVNDSGQVVGLLQAMTDETGTNGLATMLGPILTRFQVDVAVSPAIDVISPNSAVITALGPVVIEGVGFDPPVQVFFGGTPTAVLSQTSTRLEVFPPPMLVATVVDVTVVNQWGDSSGSSPTATFQYSPIV